MVHDWFATILILILTLFIGVIATIYPFVSLRFFSRGLDRLFSISRENFDLRLREYLSLLSGNPEKFKSQFGEHIFAMRSIGCVALFISLVVLTVVIQEVIGLIANWYN